ncbi:hypothetical protein GUJ93_ZPchr0007g4733 [Zizania palustris]|uniref:Uncharacterized protein n=1 Tax=Zizania palustris TaxID=103762 RepID=A0A8J5TF05_ZIZPA|nr:hypothetical protein GUJ93_ZPchr0007g4733 [Zizania palustris]
MIRGVKVRRAQEQGHRLTAHRGCSARRPQAQEERLPGESSQRLRCKGRQPGTAEDGRGSGGVDVAAAAAAGKPDGGGCKGKSPHGGVRRALQEAASMNLRAVSI